MASMYLKAYHGTHPNNVPSIMEYGFNLKAPPRSDPGDLGRAVYFTTYRARAHAVGPAILVADIHLANPLRLSMREAYALVIDRLGFDTIHGHGSPARRLEEAERARLKLLSMGHDAIVATREKHGWGDDLEIAVYDTSAILKVERLAKVSR